MQTINIVWFKKDLRLHDHLPLYQAIESGLPTLFLFFFEPSVIALPEHSARHWNFVKESLQEIQKMLLSFHTKVYVFENEVIPVFEKILTIYKINAVYSHQETGQQVTFDRDKNFAKFCKYNGIQWIESQRDGVVRGLKNRNGWSEQWTAMMQEPIKKIELHKLKTIQVEDSFFENYHLLNLDKQVVKHQLQKGGACFAWRYLQGFTEERALSYTKHISKPTESRKSCSRISPYLTWGNISIRQVYQFVLEEKQKLPFSYQFPLKNFESRLHWHCHFIQRFEMDCSMEFQSLHPTLGKVRQEVRPEWVNAWETGTTGIPLIDACMRCVNETGYLNFRMRAMLVSFLTHHLLQPWQAGVAHLARQFLDYEAGIHYCQFQMQAGVMGTSSRFRVYNPTKQALEHDPEAIFIKQWLPELQSLPTYLAIEPWKMTHLEQHLYKFRLGLDYPKPIVEVEDSAREAKQLLFSASKTEIAKNETQRLLDKHVERRK